MCSLTRVPSAAVALWRRMALVPFSSSASPMALHNFMQISEGMGINQVARLVTCSQGSGEGGRTLHLLDHRSVAVDTQFDLVEGTLVRMSSTLT